MDLNGTKLGKEKNTMDLFRLDRASCVRCGACVKDCAFGALKRDDDGYPFVKDAARCMRCQHCFAICPRGAIAFGAHTADEALQRGRCALPTGEEVENFLMMRRSYRQFKEGDVPRETLEHLLKVLGNVPTGCNARSLTFTCIPTRRAMAAFKEKFVHTIERHHDGPKLLPRWLAVPAIRLRQGKGDIFFRNAPALLIISSDETNKEVTTPREDVTNAATTFEFLAQSHHLATCWCGFLQLVQKEVPELLEDLLGFRRTTPFCAMLLGLPAVSYPRGVLRADDAKVVFVE